MQEAELMDFQLNPDKSESFQRGKTQRASL